MRAQASLASVVQKLDCKCGDLPNQTVSSLSRILYAGLVVEALLVIAWAITYRYIEWADPEAAPSPETKTETLVQVSIALVMSFCFGLYGAIAKDRGFLIGAAICQMTLLFTVHPFFPDTRLKAFAGVISAIVLAVCWMFFRTEQKIEDDNYEKEQLGLRIAFACFDLPDQTVRSLRKWALLFSAFNLGIGVALIALGAAVSAGGTARNIQMLGGSMLLSSAFAVLGAVLEHRVLLTFAFCLTLFDIAKITQFLTNLSHAKNTTDEKEARVLLACIVLYYVAIISTSCLSWITLRVSEKIQLLDVEKIKTSGTVKHSCFGKTIFATSQSLTKFLGIIAIFELFVAIACISIAAHGSTIPDYIDFNIFFAIVILSSVVSVLYGIWALDKGWLLFYALLQIWVLAQSWRSWQSSVTFITRFDSYDKALVGYVVLLTVYWVLAVFGSTLAVYLSETLNDLAQVRHRGSDFSSFSRCSLTTAETRQTRGSISRATDRARARSRIHRGLKMDETIPVPMGQSLLTNEQAAAAANAGAGDRDTAPLPIPLHRSSSSDDAPTGPTPALPLARAYDATRIPASSSSQQPAPLPPARTPAAAPPPSPPASAPSATPTSLAPHDPPLSNVRPRVNPGPLGYKPPMPKARAPSPLSGGSSTPSKAPGAAQAPL